MSDSPKKVLVLGSTGSIGTQALDVARQHGDKVKIVGLACGGRVSDMAKQAAEFGVLNVATGDTSKERELIDAMRDAGMVKGYIGAGSKAVEELIECADADIVVNSLVGAAGLRASIKALECGSRLALANKESLVVGGDLIMPLASSGLQDSGMEPKADIFTPEGRLLPIDSEHGAIFQCLLGECMSEVKKLWVTASGGPFRGRSISELEDVKVEDALAHPTWNMGRKITIDSATLMNKGLEVIEAHHLFGIPYDDIEVVVQPQSAIHSMVEFSDGSVKAHLGTTDMRIPIQFALSYPDRWDAPVNPLDFRTLGSLDFEAPDTDTFRCLELAKTAGRAGGTLPCAMNAANEVAVATFLNGECGFLDIARCVEAVMNGHNTAEVQSVEQLEEVDAISRNSAEEILRTL